MADFKASRFMGVVTLKGDRWETEFPETDLDHWLGFYGRMVAAYGARSESYRRALEALQSVKRKV